MARRYAPGSASVGASSPPAIGPRTIVAVTPSARADTELMVAFDTAGIKKLLLSLAPSERG